MTEETLLREVLKGCRVGLRADGSRALGFGHVMRTLTLASYLRRAGAEPLFLTRASHDRIPLWIQQQGIPVQTLPPEQDAEEDLASTLAALEGFRAEVVVTDFFEVPEDYLTALKARDFLVVTLDDRNRIPFPSDIVINPFYEAIQMAYRSSSGDTTFLLGPDYFLLPPEFFLVCLQPRIIRETARRIFVSLGGADLRNATGQVLRALRPLAQHGIKVQAVLGPLYPHPQELKDALGSVPYDLKIVSEPDTTVGFMLWCDVAITAGGRTVYELAASGTPGIVLPANEHEIALVRPLAPLGTMVPLGLEGAATEEGLAEALQLLLQDGAARRAMSQKGRALVDGLGHQRVLRAIAERLVRHRKGG